MLENDKNIFEKIAAGDKSAYEIIFKEYYPQLVIFALKYVDKEEDAEEIVQNLFCTIWVKRKTLKINQSVKAYLFNATRNNCFDHLKHEKVKKQYSISVLKNPQSQNNIDSDDVVSKESAKIILDAIEALPEKSKRIFKMNRFEGLKYREIAVELEISPKTVENQMGVALKKLRKVLMPYFFTEKI